MQVDIDFEFLKGLLSKNGPDPSDYERLSSHIAVIYEAKLAGFISDEQITRVRSALGEVLTAETMQGFAYQKPHGYAGDFEIIDKIYRNHKTSQKNLEKWDDYFHTLAAPKAVRNRKEYFVNLLNTISEKYPEAKVLNIASGPGRCMNSWMEENPKNSVSIECIELDPKAIEFSKKLNSKYLDKIHFEEKNILRFKPKKKYHLIWASGIFDYFNDNVFSALVKRLTPALEEGGSLIIGNFAVGNPSQPEMEVFGKWILNHRSAEQLMELASTVSDDVSDISVNSEREGVNLFLHIMK